MDAFIERLECYMDIAETKKEQKSRLLLCGLSSSQYEVLRDLVAPEVPRSKSYEELVAKLKSHYGSTRNVRIERAKFRSITRESSETISSFEVKLRNGVRYCGFTGSALEENLIEQFIQGINQKEISRKILEREDIRTLQEAIDVAETVQLLAGGSSGVASKESSDGGISRVVSRRETCFRCLRPGHKANDKEKCKAIDKTCNTCGEKGHFSGSRFCANKSQGQQTTPNRRNTQRGRRNNRQTGYQRHIEVEHNGNESEEEEEEDAVALLGAISNGKDDVPRCKAKLFGKNIPFVVDSGAAANIVSRDVYESIKDKVELKKPYKTLYAFGQSKPLDILGQFSTNLSVEDKCTQAMFFVFNGKSSNLMSVQTSRELQLLQLRSIFPEENLEAEVKAKFPECFKGIGKLKDCQIKLHVDPTCEPIAQPVRRVPFGLRDKVSELLDKLVAQDIIEPVEGVGSTWVNPVVIVPKRNGDVRMCLDMRQANKAIVRERYPMPTVQEMLAELNGSKVFSKLDLKQGFFQCELELESREITTFVTHSGLFRMKRLTMGVSSAPECFQYTIQKVFNGIPGVLNMTDDIVVFGKDQAEHKERLMKAMDRLSSCGLTLSEDKCKFGVSSIKFLGHIISAEGVAADPDKVESIVSARAPKNVAELRSFLGLVQFVGRYVPDLATVDAPLRQLCKKSVEFRWGEEQDRSFKAIQKLMGSCKTLAYFDRSAPITLVADAGPEGLGAVLLQNQEGVDKVIAYGHRRLTDVETRYSQTEREALSIVWACEHFDMYLLGNKFRLVTDHKPLTHIFNNARAKPTPRLERWSLRLQQFDFTLVYQPGASNIADPMSRLCDAEVRPQKTLDDSSEYVMMVGEEAVPEAMSWEEIKDSSSDCEEVKVIVEAIKSGNWDKCPTSVKAVKMELSECEGVVLRGSRIFIPVCLRSKVLALTHEGHQGIVKCKQRLRAKVWWPTLDKEVESLCKTCEPCQLVSGRDPPPPIVTTRMPDGPWQMCSTDLLGPLPDGRSIIVVVDYYSRFFEAGLLRSTKADKVIEFLDTIFSRYGNPLALRTDNGPQFVSDVFQQYLRTNGIKWLSTTPLWPQANGLVERTNRSILKVLKIAHLEKKEMLAEFRKFLVAYRSTPHSVTGFTPFSLMFGREMRTKLPQLDYSVDSQSVAKDNDSKYKVRMKEYADRNSRENKVVVGDTVVLRNEQKSKLDPDFKPEKFTVTGLAGSDMIVASKEDEGKVVRRNVTCAKKVLTGNDAVKETEEQQSSESEQTLRRSTRTKQAPVRYQDYDMKP